MQQLEIIHKRNLLIYYSLLITIAIYWFTIGMGLFKYHYNFPIISLIICVIISMLFYFKISPNKMKWLLLFASNVIGVLLVIQCSLILSLFWFIFYLILMSIYRSLIINIISTLLISIEAIFVVKWHFNYDKLDSFILLQSYIFFLILLCLVCLFLTIYLKMLWGRVEKRNMKKEQELFSTEAYLKLFFNYAEDAIAVFDLDNKIIEVNPAFERLYGWTREECIGKNLVLVPPQNTEAMMERLDKLLKGERIHLLETQDMRKDGTLFDAQLSLTPIYNYYGEIIAISVISRDVSYIKENERLILQSEKLKFAGEIAAGVAHEVRNPMTVISGFVQLMKEDKECSYYPFTDIIKSEIDRIDLIISEFLLLSTPKTDMEEIINLQNTLMDMSTYFQIQLKNNNIGFHISSTANDVLITGNQNQIKQVLINIIKNAIEAIKQNGKITAELLSDTQYVTLVITDSGVGMSAHLVKHIFEPFFTTKEAGTGLGMMITNKIVQEHNGNIQISSEENKGTKIELKFPKYTA